MLVGLDLVRAGVAVLLPFVTEVWQVYLLIFLLQSASAAFTPIFQATIPDIIADEDRYTRALSLSRLAYALENLISPMLAAALLAVVSYNGLFIGTSIGFVAAAILIVSVALPAVHPAPPTQSAPPAVAPDFLARVTRGMRIYLATPRLRGLLALNFAAAAAGAMVLVTTVVLIRADRETGLALGDSEVAIALAVFGGGSMLAALVLPRSLERLDSRRVMFAGTLLMCLTLLAFATAIELDAFVLATLLAAWFSIGLGYSAALTPAGRLLRQSSHSPDRRAIFAAQFSLSHACWLVTYPLAGWLVTVAGPAMTLWSLAGLAIAGLLTAGAVWPRMDIEELEHDHDDLPADHPNIYRARDHIGIAT